VKEKKRFDDEKRVVENETDITNGDVLLASRRCRASIAKAEQYKNTRSAALLKAYVAQLEALIKQLVMQDKIEPAKAVREELDRAAFMLADAESKLPPPPVVAKVVKPVIEPPAPPAPKIKVAKTSIEPAVPPPSQQVGKPKTMDLGGGITMEFVPIPAGSFLMGSGNGGVIPVHKVTITKSFYITKYEVTQEQWEAIMGSNPSNSKGAKNPVEMVSWKDCQGFLARLKDRAPGMEVRLPTEAEWEYACRAGSRTDFCYGNDALKLSDYAWFSGETSHPVGEKKANTWGLHDMHGNVWEWCSDWVGTYDSTAETDPVGPASGEARVRRGGAFCNEPGDCGAASSIGLGPDDHSYDVGLRVVVVGR
jgi:formylglycine-generating enzyme required for sulfatase activity